jgi:hypothetical protein
MISADLGKPLARGRTADIYQWENGRVLKLFHEWFDLADILFEQKLGQQVHLSGLPVPAVGEILYVNGRNGLIYERVIGQNMWEAVQKQPWLIISLARKTAQLQAWMHATPIQSDLPLQRHRLENKLKSAKSLPDHLRKDSLIALSTLPDGNSICHGDFHPGNILLSPDRAVVIDWIDSSRGNPLADVARTSIIVLGAARTSQIPHYLSKFIVRLFHLIYIRTYFQLRPGGGAEYRRWLPVIAAARLSENMPELETWLLKLVKSGLR